LLQDSVICSAGGFRGGLSAAFKKRILRPMGPSFVCFRTKSRIVILPQPKLSPKRK
jgi:hypothetical protein